MKPISRILMPAVAVVLSPALCLAQQTSKPDKPAKTAPAKPAPKVWTGDDLTSLRTPADDFARQQQAEAAAAAAAKQQASSAKPSQAAPHDHPPLLSNPKTSEAADNMIAWEDRDLAAQQEYVERLKNQLDSAPPDQKAHLEQTIADEMKTIAAIQQEKQGLVQQKQQLEKKQAASNSSSQPQSQ